MQRRLGIQLGYNTQSQVAICLSRPENLGFVNFQLKLWRDKNIGAVQARIWWEDEWKEMIRLNANAPSL